MISKTLPLISEVINGAWVVVAASLAVMATVYLTHEFRARGGGRPWTSGMRMAMSLLVLSVGVGLAHIPIWEWRHFEPETIFGETRAGVMSFGAFLGATGFLLATREVSLQLYGNAPWLATAGTMLVFLIATAASYWL